MDQINPNSSPFSPENMVPAKKSYGPLIAVLVILFIIVIGGLYFLGQRMNQAPYEMPPQAIEEDQVVNSLQNYSESDELEMIETDLNATNLDNLDQGASSLEAELQ